jgi:hypothetical protein
MTTLAGDWPMRRRLALAFALAGLTATTALAQQSSAPALGEVMVTASRGSIPYAGQDRPVVGLRRTADSAVMSLVIVSDTREAAARTQEIYTVLLAAMDKAAGAGVELVYGGTPIYPVTRANYQDLPLLGAGRVDTSQLQLLVKARLSGSAAATQAKLRAFINSLKGSGRATVSTGGGISLTVIDPDQYRSQIVSLVAADAKATTALFGPDFTFSVTGIDGQVVWAQVSSSEVFLYIPYRYSIIPRQ